MLDRMEIEEAGPDPVRIAREIHRQMGFPDGAVDLGYLADCLDIHEIKYERLNNIEGALVTTPSRYAGSILVNKRSGKARRRFTIGHELGHYLNPAHQETSAQGFWCSKNDINSLRGQAKRQLTGFEKQEVEANRFASELLMPSRQIKRSLEAFACLEEVVKLARIYGVSKEAMARKYVELRSEPIAIIFSKDGRLRYPVKGRKMPRLYLKEGALLPHLDKAPFKQNVHAFGEVNPYEWLLSYDSGFLYCEHYPQQDGYAMTLLQLGE